MSAPSRIHDLGIVATLAVPILLLAVQMTRDPALGAVGLAVTLMAVVTGLPPAGTPAAPPTVEDADDPDDGYGACPACGDPIDYCTGHGDIGDPDGSAILAAHDDGRHGDCHPLGCDDAPLAAEFAAARRVA